MLGRRNVQVHIRFDIENRKHLIQKPSSWWLEKLIRHFDILQLQTHQMMGVGFWVLVRPTTAAV